MAQDLVSIITPCYNGARFLGETIESVLAQTYPNWEMIIVDDGSKDNSAEIARNYMGKDNRIKLIQQANGGSAAARNNGIKNANGRYIALLDSDDLWEPEFLESQLNFMNEKKCLLVYSSHKRINEEGKECLKPFLVNGAISYDDLLKSCSISCLTGLYDTSKYGKIFLREDLRSLRDDFVFWLTILKKVGIAYANPQIIASYRILGDSTSRNKRKVIIPQFLVYYKIEKLGLIKACII
jgi:teichuronic acid biosynthesis glycosyltransferase TuaG